MDYSSSYVNNSSNVVRGTDSVTQLSSKELGKDDFLRLLVAEITNQDPMSPMDNKDMILQLSQFSALEGTLQLNQNMENYIVNAEMSTASSMIGKEVTYLDEEYGVPVVGQVSKMAMYGDSPKLYIDGVLVGMDQILTVSEPSATSTTDSSSSSSTDTGSSSSGSTDTSSGTTDTAG